MALEIRLRPLTAEAFAPFGDVIEAAGASELINRGTARQFADLARIEVAAAGGRPRVSIIQATAVRLPFSVRLLERHPLSSQCFVPLARERLIVIVAPPGDSLEPQSIRAFLSDGRQGVNYRPGTWHHPLLAYGAAGDFLVIDRAGSGDNCEERALEEHGIVVLGPGKPGSLNRRRGRRSRTSAR